LKLSEVVKFSPTWWKMLGALISNKIRRRCRNEHKNAKGEAFQPYSANYREMKTQYKAHTKGVPQSSTSGIPDMTFSGKMLNDLKPYRWNNDSVEIGFLGYNAEKVKRLHNLKNYRVINLDSGDPFSAEEMKAIEKAFDENIEKKINDYCKTPVVLYVGGRG